jgi:hypothetical protein
VGPPGEQPQRLSLVSNVTWRKYKNRRKKKGRNVTEQEKERTEKKKVKKFK